MLAVTVCFLFGISAFWDEKEGKIPRMISYTECFLAVAVWLLAYGYGMRFAWINVWVFWGYFGLCSLFCVKHCLGRADLYLIFSMLLFLRVLVAGEDFFLAVVLFFLTAFISAGIRLACSGGKNGCPLGAHLLGSFLLVECFSQRNDLIGRGIL